MLSRKETQDICTCASVIDFHFYEYLYLRKNIAGIHNELWFHQQGDRSWLVISRNTLTHEIIKVDFAIDFSKKNAKQQ